MIRTGDDRYISERHHEENLPQHSPAFKTKVVLEALKERETLSELAHRHSLNSTQIAAWKKEFLDGAEQVFSDGPVVDAKAHAQEKAALHEQIGELTVTVNWLKKKLL
jgi:transposase